MYCLRSHTAEVRSLIAPVKAPCQSSGHILKTSHVRLWLKLLNLKVRPCKSCKELAIAIKSFGLYAGTLLVAQLAQVFAKSFMKQQILIYLFCIFFSMMVEWHCQRKVLEKTLRILKFYRPCCILTDWHEGLRKSSVDCLWRVYNYWQKYLDLCQISPVWLKEPR